MTDYEEQHAWICDHVLTSLPGADSQQVQRTYMRKVDHFLQEASCWIDDAVFTADTFGNVKLDFSHIEAQMVWIHKILFESIPLTHTTIIPPALETRQGSRPTTYTNTPYPDVIILFPRPNTGLSINVTARCALKLAKCSDADQAVPDWIFNRYKEAIRTGVLGDMMAESGKPYSNFSQGLVYKGEYSHAIAKSRDEARRGFGFHESEWAYPQGYSV
jgi:hypothetical protein